MGSRRPQIVEPKIPVDLEPTREAEKEIKKLLDIKKNYDGDLHFNSVYEKGEIILKCWCNGAHSFKCNAKLLKAQQKQK